MYYQGDFFSLGCCLATCHLMEAEDTNVLNVMYAKWDVCALSAPSNSCLG